LTDGHRRPLENQRHKNLQWIGSIGLAPERFLLDGVVKEGHRETEINSEEIIFFGKCRAVVPCIVVKDGQRFHNLRLFVRTTENDAWKLLGWANERL
jgi:hypothetical protein